MRWLELGATGSSVFCHAPEDAYAGTVDAATGLGFDVILSYWEDGTSSGGMVVNTAALDAMRNAVVAKYGADSHVYFEPMNEPHGYTAAAWADVAASWVAAHPSVPRDRIVVSGSGYDGEVTSVCADQRLTGTRLSLHLYKTYDEWITEFNNRIGSCGARTVLDEFGAPMDDGRDYNDAASTDNFVRYLRAATDIAHSLGKGSVYWPGLGGKHTYRPDYDWYALYRLEGTASAPRLRVHNTTGLDRLAYAWGTRSGSPTTALTSLGTQDCLDVPLRRHDPRGAVRTLPGCGPRHLEAPALLPLGQGQPALEADCLTPHQPARPTGPDYSAPRRPGPAVHPRAERDILRELSPGVPVTTNFMVMGSTRGMNYPDWAEEIDFVSNDQGALTLKPRGVAVMRRTGG
ncbi:Beta-galactosidase [Streptomyces sp. 2131.1]|nr:Beta-galactosidase [Streptomyces sp. 2131.1]